MLGPWIKAKLEVVKQEMARMNVDILGVSELKWTGMGEFNSDDHCIYYCGQESFRRNGVALIVNKRVWNAVCEVAQSCPTLSDPMDCSPPGSSVHGILRARILEWVAISFSRGSSQARDPTRVSHIAGRCFILWATREALKCSTWMQSQETEWSLFIPKANHSVSH